MPIPSERPIRSTRRPAFTILLEESAMSQTAAPPKPQHTAADKQAMQTLTMPLGQALFTQRAIRRVKPDPIPVEHLHLILEAAQKAPNGGNRQPARFLVVNDRARIQDFAKLYREAWWSKRADEKQPWTRREDIPEHDRNHRAAARLADEIKDAPCVVFVFAENNGPANSVFPAIQNLMLAARALGVGSVPTTLHAKVMERFNAMFKVPAGLAFHCCIPLGYPQGHFGPTNRKPSGDVTYFNQWGGKAPWA
jgi:nitroreductase